MTDQTNETQPAPLPEDAERAAKEQERKDRVIAAWTKSMLRPPKARRPRRR